MNRHSRLHSKIQNLYTQGIPKAMDRSEPCKSQHPDEEQVELNLWLEEAPRFFDEDPSDNSKGLFN